MNKVQSNFPRRAFFIPPSTMRDKTVQGVNQNKLFTPVILCKAILRAICFSVLCFVINPSQSLAKDHVFVALMCDVVAYQY